MMLAWFGWAGALLLVGFLAALLARRRDRAALALGSGAAIAACVIGAAGSVIALLLGRKESVLVPWTLPVGEVHLGLDPLASFFLLCIFVVSGLAAA
jgi:formate hydrogenlyase subunit 3/multisubunit Na+/H+ antiporter MnhD subunit